MALFKPKWMTDNRAKLDKAVQAVGKIGDQEALAEAALHAPLEEVRIAAAKKAVSQDVLERIVEQSGEKPVVQAALHNLMMAYAGRLRELERIAYHPDMANEDILDILQAVEPEARQRIIKEHVDNEDLMLQVALHALGTGTQRAAVRHIFSYEALLQVAEITVGAKTPAYAAKRLAELYPDKAKEELERAIVRQIRSGFIKQAVELREQLDAPRDARRFERDVVDALIFQWLSIQGESAREAARLIQSLTRPDALFMLACNLRFKDAKSVAESRTKKGRESLATVVFSMLDNDQLVRLVEDNSRLEKECTPDTVRAIRQCALIELASRSDGQQVLEGIVEQHLDERDPRGLQFITDVPWLLAVSRSGVKPSVQSRLCDVVKSEDAIADILINGLASHKEVVAGSPASASCDKDRANLVSRVKDKVMLEKLSVEARDVYIRSVAARRLREKHGCDAVRVLHDVCQYCGGAVAETMAYAGTTEEHLRWDCQGCGRFQDKTLFGRGSSNQISGDYYVFGELGEWMDASSLEPEPPASPASNGAEEAAAASASAPAAQPPEAELTDSYECKGCGHVVWFGPDSADPCVCPSCGTENHRWFTSGNVIDYRDYSAGTRWDECSRCGARKNYRTVNTM
ncbi:MAG: hypothetical protein Q4C36_00510 [Coriobacteriia bacterium]|nr:hypothetical protein [Coriobacteriia bacterium]